MKASSPLSCILLLSFGACFPPDNGQESRYPGEEFGATEGQPDLWEVKTPKWKRSTQDLNTLVGIAKELQSFGKEKAGIQFRFGRQQGAQDKEDEVSDDLRGEEEGSEKRGASLGSLAEELSDYERKKGGFSFRFGRGRRAECF